MRAAPRTSIGRQKVAFANKSLSFMDEFILEVYFMLNWLKRNYGTVEITKLPETKLVDDSLQCSKNAGNVTLFESNCIVGGLLHLCGLVSSPELTSKELSKRIYIQKVIYRNFYTYRHECSNKEELFEKVFKSVALEVLFNESQLSRAIEICLNTRGDLLIEALSMYVSCGQLTHV